MFSRSESRYGNGTKFLGTSLVVLIAGGLAVLTGRVIGDHPGQGGRPLEAVLTGDAEVPGPGHPDASGSASLRLNAGRGEVCFSIEFEGIDPDDPDDLITAGHIHVGAADVAGPVVVNFQLGADGPVPVDEEGRGTVSGCVNADREVIQDILRNPEGYYVNLHSPNFPPGAIRGQLSR